MWAEQLQIHGYIHKQDKNSFSKKKKKVKDFDFLPAWLEQFQAFLLCSSQQSHGIK